MQRLVQTNLGIEPAVLVEIYRQLSRIRAVDKAIQAGLSGGKFLFSYWPMTGQEAIPATLSQLIDSRDYMVTTYRGIHDQVAKGVALEGLFAEMFGRSGGVNKGKGGSPHISDPSSGSMLTTAIVGWRRTGACGLSELVRPPASALQYSYNVNVTWLSSQTSNSAFRIRGEQICR